MKTILVSREQLKEKLRSFPSYYSNVLSSSYTSIVVCVTNQNRIVAACGIQKPLNYLVVYVQEGYRGQGLGTLAVKKAVKIARKSNFNFINLAVSTENLPALHLYSRVDFRASALFPKFKFKVMTLPLSFKGEVIYAFFNRACSLLPEIILMHLLLFFMKIVKNIRQIGVVSFQGT